MGGLNNGVDRISSAEVLDLSGQGRNCNTVPDAPLPLTSHVMVTLNSKPVVCGGRDNVSKSTDCNLYDVTSNQWSPISSMNTPRSNHKSLQLGEDKFLMTGK